MCAYIRGLVSLSDRQNSAQSIFESLLYVDVVVKIRPRKAFKYPNWRSFGWVSYDKVGVLYSGKLGIDWRHVPPISEAIPGSGGNE